MPKQKKKYNSFQAFKYLKKNLPKIQSAILLKKMEAKGWIIVEQEGTYQLAKGVSLFQELLDDFLLEIQRSDSKVRFKKLEN